MAEMFNGVVASIGVFPIKEHIKNMTVKKAGKYFGRQFNIDKTHTISIKCIGLMVNGEEYTKWIQIGHREFKEGRELSWRVEDKKEWKDVWDGSEIFFFYDVNDDGYVNIDVSTIKLMKQAPRPDMVYTFGDRVDDNSEGGGTSTGINKHKYDPVGLMKGNSFNGAMSIIKHNPKKATFDGVKDICKSVFEVNQRLQKKYPEEVGSVLGMCISEACNMTDDVTKVEAIAEHLLNDIVKPLGDYLKENEDNESPNVTDKPKEEEKPKPDPDDIPF